MEFDDAVCEGIDELIKSVVDECKVWFEYSPIIKMIAASEMKNVKEKHVDFQQNKVMKELQDALNFDNDFVEQTSEELHNTIYNIVEHILSDFYVKIWNHQLSKIDLTYLEVDNCFDDFYYGRIGSECANKYSDEMIKTLKNKNDAKNKTKNVIKNITKNVKIGENVKNNVNKKIMNIKIVNEK